MYGGVAGESGRPLPLCRFTDVLLAGSQAGKARDCYSRHAQVRILPGQPIFEGRQGSLVQ